MNFFETMICLTLLAILTTLGVFAYQPLLVRTQVHSDTRLVKTALQEARTLAGSVKCVNTHCLIASSHHERTISLSGKNIVETKLFPASAEGVFTFTDEGITAHHNGTIYIFPEDKPELGKKVVVSQGGRVS